MQSLPRKAGSAVAGRGRQEETLNCRRRIRINRILNKEETPATSS